MLNPEPLLLDLVSPRIRSLLVSLRVNAMSGQLAASVEVARATIKDGAQSSADNVGLGMLIAELYYLDGMYDESIASFHQLVTPYVKLLPSSVQIVTDENLSLTQMAALSKEGVENFYHVVDRKRLLKFEYFDPSARLDAERAIEEGKYKDAAATLWQFLGRAYALGSWYAMRTAAGRYGKLCLEQGALALAAHHLIVAHEPKQIEVLAEALLKRQDREVIHSLVAHITTYCRLERHFVLASRLVGQMYELIDDADLIPIGDWLLPHCRRAPTTNGGGSMHAAWELVAILGDRFPATVSHQISLAALGNAELHAPIPDANRVLPYRKSVLKGLNAVLRAGEVDDIQSIVSAIIPLAVERIQDYDYLDALSLLCRLAEIGGAQVKSEIGNALYIEGKPLNRVLAQLSMFFGVEPLSDEGWECLALKVIDELKLIVQRLEPNETAKPVPGSLMTMHVDYRTSRVQVVVFSGLGLQAIKKAKGRLSVRILDDLVTTMVKVTIDPDNIHSNRECLLYYLCDYSDLVSPDVREWVVKTVEPLSRGHLCGTENVSDGEVAPSNVSSRFTNLGSMEQVQAMALRTLAAFAGSDPRLSARISDSLVDGFVHPNAKVRAGAYAAAKRQPNLAGDQLIPLLMGLRDSDTTAACAAFAAFAARPEWRLTRPMWKLFILAIRLTSQMPDTNLRSSAAHALAIQLVNAPNARSKAEAEVILKQMKSDIAYSVRYAASSSTSLAS